MPYGGTSRKWANKYLYGKSFRIWMNDNTMGPYNSWGNGSAIRVSPLWLFVVNRRSVEKSRGVNQVYT